MTLTPERKMTVITIAIIGAVLLLGAGGIYYLQFNVLKDVKRQVADLNQKVEGARKKSAGLPALKETVGKLKSESAKLEQVIPVMEPLVFDRFINTLNDFRKKCGVVLDNVKVMISMAHMATRPGEKPLPKNVRPIEFEIKVMGSFFPLLKFMYALETNERLITIEKFTVTPKKSKEETGFYEVRVTIKTFIYDEEAKKEAGTPKVTKEGHPAPALTTPIRE